MIPNNSVSEAKKKLPKREFEREKKGTRNNLLTKSETHRAQKYFTEKAYKLHELSSVSGMQQE